MSSRSTRPPGGGARVRLVSLSVDAMAALLDDDLAEASARAGLALTPFIHEENWLWRIRLAQIRRDPGSARWVARLGVVDDRVIGHAGFHGPPDEHGMVEAAYAVDPACRGHGYATEMLAELLRRAEDEPSVRVVRATVAPDNTASRAVVSKFGFVEAGEQWDEVDGVELVFELALGGRVAL